MFGKYFDSRTHQHFVHTYSRVPYLDTQIFDLETSMLRESRRIKNRTDLANTGNISIFIKGLERTRLKSEQLSKNLRESRVKRQDEDKSFMIEL